MTREQISYDVLGTATTGATLTDAYSGNTKTIESTRYFDVLHLDIKYTPKAAETNRYAKILVEYSNDGGTTYFPISTQANTTTNVLVYDNDTGVDIIFPGDMTSTGGISYSGSAEFNFTADKIKISAKEDSAGNHGTLYIRATLRNK
jgi:hypothetical protein